jgi:hypothetical protein
MLIIFISGKGKFSKSIMLVRFSWLHHGFDLLEGNIHDQDRPLSTKLEMSNACRSPKSFMDLRPRQLGFKPLDTKVI